MRYQFILFFLLLLSSCVIPLMVSVYVPEGQEFNETSKCGASLISFPILNAKGIKITAAFDEMQAANGFGGIGIELDEGVFLEFGSNEIRVTSSQFAETKVFEFDYRHVPTKFFTDKGIRGPLRTYLSPAPNSLSKVENISIQMPEIRANGNLIATQPVNLKLRKRLAVVGLCQ
jgi:hypothetical protein